MMMMIWAFLLAVGTAHAVPANSSVKVTNHTHATVTVNTDLGYGCTADAGDVCTFATTTGRHTLVAKRHDNDRTRTETVTVTAAVYELALTDGNP